MEEKYGKGSTGATHVDSPMKNSDENSESTSESEDEGILATEELDGEINATIDAIKSKDPKVYDKTHRFYQEDGQTRPRSQADRQEKPMTLQEYHRRNLLDGENGEEEEEQAPNHSIKNEDNWKNELVRQIHSAADEQVDVNQSPDDEEFLQTRSRPEQTESNTEMPLVTEADKDPDAFLNSLMASRAWVPTDKTEWHPFESDDEADENRADEFEEAFNMRFENPDHVNEKLVSHSRTAAAEQSVRREKVKGRKKAREIENSRKEVAKQERGKEKRRLRNLRIEQAHEKLQQFKEAAGIKDEDLPVEVWSNFLDAAFDGDKWDEEMQKQFGDNYYAIENADKTSRGYDGKESKPHKPEWKDDIHIDDIVPEFGKEDEANFSLSDEDPTNLNYDDENGGQANPVEDERSENRVASTSQDANSGLGAQDDGKRRARRERRHIEDMVDASLDMDILPSRGGEKKAVRGFRYRETSPVSFGLSSKDILLADDSSLNQHHGLKKLGSFRDSARKSRDRKKLDKKRLRKWRKETFGNSEGPQTTFHDYVRAKVEGNPPSDIPDASVNLKQVESSVSKTKKKRRRSKKDKGGVTGVPDEPGEP